MLDINNCIQLLNRELRTVSDWVGREQLQINLIKTKAIVFGVSEDDMKRLPPTSLKDTTLSFLNKVKILGIILS